MSGDVRCSDLLLRQFCPVGGGAGSGPVQYPEQPVWRVRLIFR